jgi:hypothetical protein
MTVPRRFVGAWQRECLEVDGRVVAGIGRAMWVEAGGMYVDVRGPGILASNTSFGGRSSWRSPLFTWHHDVDLGPASAGTDRGELGLEGDRIIERGVGLTAAGVPYVEHWRRMPNQVDVTARARHEHGVAVRAGNYAAAVGAETMSAQLWHRARGAWSELITLGSGAALPVPDDSAWRLPRGWVLTT